MGKRGVNMADVELLIKIPEEDWEFIKEADGCRWSRAILDGVINGTPLPKGHGRLIDANYFREDSSIFDIIPFAQRMNIECVVDHAPTIIEADKGSEIKEKQDEVLKKDFCGSNDTYCCSLKQAEEEELGLD